MRTFKWNIAMLLFLNLNSCVSSMPSSRIKYPYPKFRVVFLFCLYLNSLSKSRFFQSLGPTLSFMRLPRWQLITQLNEIGSRASVEAEKKLDIQLGHQSSHLFGDLD